MGRKGPSVPTREKLDQAYGCHLGMAVLLLALLGSIYLIVSKNYTGDYAKSVGMFYAAFIFLPFSPVVALGLYVSFVLRRQRHFPLLSLLFFLAGYRLLWGLGSPPYKMDPFGATLTLVYAAAAVGLAARWFLFTRKGVLPGEVAHLRWSSDDPLP
jgi:hypothetical protein